MMYSAEKMSEAIRMKRKKLKKDGVENMVDTAPLPQMNPQDIWNLEKEAQIEETIDHAVSMDGHEESPEMMGGEMDDSQKLSVLKAKMAKIKAIFDKL